MWLTVSPACRLASTSSPTQTASQKQDMKTSGLTGLRKRNIQRRRCALLTAWTFKGFGAPGGSSTGSAGLSNLGLLAVGLDFRTAPDCIGTISTDLRKGVTLQAIPQRFN